ncbi:helix-turn-helix transcriptional regulator [Lacisediminimonas sp.]|uniref:helix-turn-helix domain-containing protein n=1 Tax=Lacisediminimonas sp. TaxID=3060582 RepID=UPI00271874C6|nr:helix-turn-helix transcriptional regulator [Lacisediminimonas sp.]MDO8298854.1 helix-turn-helix transcriptional regulator [Lacisediminimonas sp.]
MMTSENSVLVRPVLRDMLDHLKRVRQCERDEDLARLIGIAPSTLSHYRSGSRWPGLDNCERIAFLLGIDPEQVIEAVKTGRRCSGGREAN